MPTQQTPNRLRVDVVTGIEELQSQWSALAEAAGNPFATWEWGSVWWRHYGGERPLCIACCTGDAGSVLAIVPLYLARTRPARILRFLGHGPGDHLGPICAPGSERPVARIIDELLELRPQRWEILLAERVPADAGLPQVIGGSRLKLEPSPLLPTGDRSWEDFLAGRSSNFRGQVRRRERKLAREHRMSYRLATDPGRLEADMDVLARLHAARWEGGGSGALSGRRLAFHKEFAALALRRGWLRLWFLEIDEAPVAAWYGFRFGGDEWYYQSGRDPAWDAYSVGFVLLCHTLRESFGDRCGAYRFLRGDEEYKARFATGTTQLETAVRACGPRGRAVAAAASLSTRLPVRLRRPLAAAAR